LLLESRYVSECAHAPRFSFTFFDHRSLMSDCYRSGMPQCVDDLVFWIIYYRARNEKGLEQWRGPREKRALIHWVWFDTRTETFRSLSVFTLRTIGPSQWALSISSIKGVTQRYRKMRPSYTQNRRTAAILFDEVTVALLQTNHRLGNKEHPISTSFRTSTSARP